MRSFPFVLCSIVAILLAFALGYASKSFVAEGPGDRASMRRATGIGGIFFKSKDPAKLRGWYKERLGFETDEYGTNFEWRQGRDSTLKGFTQWSPFSDTTGYFRPSTRDFMINYRVEDLVTLIAELRKEGVVVTDTIESFDYGKFAHILDGEGNKVELWEPNDIVYDKAVVGRTK